MRRSRVAALARDPARAAWLGWSAWALTLLAVGTAWVLLESGGGAGADGCALRRVAGVACPTCGMTRAFLLLGRGDWVGSLALHPGALLLALQVAVAWAWWGLWLGGRVASRPDRWLPTAVGLNVAGFLALWVARLLGGMLP